MNITSAYIQSLRDGRRIPIDVSRDPDAEFGENIREWIDGIVRQDFVPAGSPGLCKRCDFRKACRHGV